MSHAELPRALPRIEYVPSTGQVIRVKSGDSIALRAGLQNLKPNETIELEPGGSWEGNFVISNPITGGLRTVRMPMEVLERLKTNAKDPGRGKLVTRISAPVLQTSQPTYDWQFVGVEFTEDNGCTDLVQIDHGGNFLFDRVWAHGTPTTNCRRGIRMNAASMAVVNSFITECHEIGREAQGLCGWAGSGPYAIIGCLIEGAGEGVMFGGEDPKIANIVPSDITVRRNTIRKPLSWRDASSPKWGSKNLFELKNARRVLIDGNMFENNWESGQDGMAILFTTRNQEGTAPWSIVQHVTYSNNWLHNSAGGISILGKDYNYPSMQGSHIHIDNNLFTRLTRKLSVSGKINGRFMLIQGGLGVHVTRNTVDHEDNVITASGTPDTDFHYIGNLSRHNEYGIKGDGEGIGMTTINRYFPNSTIHGNLLAGWHRPDMYPKGNMFGPWPSFDVTWRQNTYPGIGCDIAQLEAAMRGSDPTPPSETVKQRLLRLNDELREEMEKLP
jgi:hypothetical protein